MPNILINPNSGIIEFTTGTAGVSTFDANIISGNRAARLSYDNFGSLNLTSYVSNVTGVDRFTVDGTNGRLFSVTDNLSGSLFSVNDIAGLPIIEAFDDNTVIMGAYNRNDFILTGNSIGMGGIPNTGTQKLYVSGNLHVTGGNIYLNGYTLGNVNVTPAANYTITANESLIRANSAGGAFTLTLPNSTTVSGKQYIIKKISSDANAVTVTGVSSQRLDDMLGYNIYNRYEALSIVSFGTGWDIV
jgi:hypothetical protein